MSPIVPYCLGGGLAAHEAAGGHLLARHVGLSESQLASRLASQPGISAASTFLSRAVAEDAVAATIHANEVKIASWLAEGGTRAVVTHTMKTPVGLTMTRGSAAATETSGVQLVLTRDVSSPLGFRILTGYPK